MNTMSFYELRSEKQAQALEVTFSRRKQNNLRNAQMHIRSENLFYQTNLFIDFKT